MKVALFQMNIAWQAPKDNIKKVRNAIEKSKAEFDLLVLPEMFNTGFSMHPEEIAEPMNGNTLKQLLILSKKYGIGIITSIPTAVDKQYYNRLYLIDDGMIVDHYDKNYLFSPAKENLSYTHGNKSDIMIFRDVHIQPQICYDIRFPELLSGKKGIDILINVSNWPEKRIHHYHALLAGRAVENQCFTIGMNRTGTDNHGWIYNGASTIFDYNADPILQLDDREQLSIISLDIEASRTYKKKLPFLEDKR